MHNENKVPLIRLAKRDMMEPWKVWCIRLASIVLALLLGGGLNNLYDRYTKGHVVDYFHLNFGPKWLRAIVFNISDFCIFIGALLAVAGSEVS